MIKRYLHRISEGLVLILIGSTVLILIPFQIDSISGVTVSVTPSFLPVILGISLVLVGIGLCMQLFRKSLEPENKAESVKIPDLPILRVLLASSLLIVYTILFPAIGFLVTSAIFVGIFSYLFGARSLLKVSLTMALVPIGVWLFFERLFHIPLPHGLLF